MRHLDPCPHCPGTMRKYCTRTKGKLRTRYLKCDRCKTTDQEVFRVDERGRAIFESCTPMGTSPLHLHRHP